MVSSPILVSYDEIVIIFTILFCVDQLLIQPRWTVGDNSSECSLLKFVFLKVEIFFIFCIRTSGVLLKIYLNVTSENTFLIRIVIKTATCSRFYQVITRLSIFKQNFIVAKIISFPLKSNLPLKGMIYILFVM